MSPRTMLVLAAALLAPLAAPASAQDLTMPTLGAPVVVRPSAAPVGAVVLFSDSQGWTDGDRDLAHTLAARGMLVMGFDLAATATRMATATQSCATVIGEVENVSHTLQRETGADAYHFPVLAGIGGGGAFALAVAAQTAAATIDRVEAVDPAPALSLPKPLCAAAPDTPRSFPVGITLTPAAGAAVRTHADALKTQQPGLVLKDSPLSPMAALAAAVERPETATTDSLSDLPLVELPVPTRSDSFAILYSGDGGWRDLDKDLAAILQKDGLPVVGVDVLRYFWKKRSPEQSAADLSRVIRSYRQKWGARQVVLIGFSFGADVLPPLFNHLPAADRAAVVQMSLLGMSASADFEVTVAEWLDRKSKDAVPTIPEVRRLDPRRVQCFYGQDDEDAACSQLDGSGVEVVHTTGGHHFDGDYPALARRILAGVAARAVLPPTR